MPGGGFQARRSILPRGFQEAEDRFRAIEDFLHENFGLGVANLDVLANVGTVGDGTGAGAAGLVVTGSDGGAGTSTLSGDVTGPAGGNTVERVRNQSIAAGTGTAQLHVFNGTSWEIGPSGSFPSDGSQRVGMSYDNLTGTFKMRDMTAFNVLGCWGVASIAALGGVAAEIPNTWSVGGAANIPITPFGDFFMWGMGVMLSGDMGGVGDSLTVTVYKNGVATGLTFTLNGTAGADYGFNTGLGSPTKLVNTDRVTIYASVAGAPAAVSMIAYILGTYDGR
jgi:hypothetical protein